MLLKNPILLYVDFHITLLFEDFFTTAANKISGIFLF
jgi:hypothetical protein